MRRTILLAIIACILGIVLLAALAFYIPDRLGPGRDDGQSERFTGFEIATENVRQTPAPAPAQTEALPDGTDALPPSASSAGDLQNETLPSGGIRNAKITEETEEAAPAAGSGRPSGMAAAGSTEHRIIWVGDSRTLGLRNALGKTDRADEDLFIGKVGEGVRWFREEGMEELSSAIREHPDLPVVMNFGVNDPQLINEYVTAYWDVIRAHPNTDFYILSVNPLDEEFLIEDGQVDEAVFNDINSLNVARMNVKLKKEFQSRYLDSASFLKADGFETVDGLHFSTQTYLKIHDYVVSLLF